MPGLKNQLSVPRPASSREDVFPHDIFLNEKFGTSFLSRKMRVLFQWKSTPYDVSPRFSWNDDLGLILFAFFLGKTHWDFSRILSKLPRNGLWKRAMQRHDSWKRNDDPCCNDWANWKRLRRSWSKPSLDLIYNKYELDECSQFLFSLISCVVFSYVTVTYVTYVWLLVVVLVVFVWMSISIAKAEEAEEQLTSERRLLASDRHETPFT